MARSQRIAVVGGGWAGMAAAVELAANSAHQVTVWESSAHWGGRARGLPLELPGGETITVDNGQHILIGAYTACRALMERVGVSTDASFIKRPLAMRYPDGRGIQFPDSAPPWDALFGIARAKGWSLMERLQLLRRAAAWQRQGFRCAPQASVADLCAGLPQRLLTEFFDPLCISALNTPLHEASGQVFLRVLQDSLFAVNKGSHFWLPLVDLGQLFPSAAATWLQARGHDCHLGGRVQQLGLTDHGWQIQGQRYDQVLLACPAWEAARLVQTTFGDASTPSHADALPWADSAQRLTHTAIATVYAWNPEPGNQGHSLPAPWLALESSPTQPAQFVFDRAQLGDPPGLLAFVISTSDGDRADIEQQVIAQAQAQLGLALQPLKTIVEKRATFACTPGLQRPGMAIAPGLIACGDYIDGPYPATLEGAVRSGIAAAHALA
ncbi:hydroxysqualene dehydroxylase HpnE [Comamonas piscis]